jgi:hypothetical protein
VTQPEYITALFSIIVGLGLTDLAQSFRELVRPQRPTDWHWLPLLWAASTFLLAVQLWWNSFSTIKEATAQFFFPYLISFVFLYLTCAFALPDPEWVAPRKQSGSSPDLAADEGTALDLEAFYFSEQHRRWYFGVFIGLIVTAQVGFQTARVLKGEALTGRQIAANGVLAALLGSLIPTDRWWIHAPISVLCFLLIGWTTVNSILNLA